jgi:hypothetical protein
VLLVDQVRTSMLEQVSVYMVESAFVCRRLRVECFVRARVITPWLLLRTGIIFC